MGLEHIGTIYLRFHHKRSMTYLPTCWFCTNMHKWPSYSYVGHISDRQYSTHGKWQWSWVKLTIFTCWDFLKHLRDSLTQMGIWKKMSGDGTVNLRKVWVRHLQVVWNLAFGSMQQGEIRIKALEESQVLELCFFLKLQWYRLINNE